MLFIFFKQTIKIWTVCSFTRVDNSVYILPKQEDCDTKSYILC